MKKYILFLILVIPLFIHAQFKVIGNIKDTNGLPLEAATIFLKQNDKEISSVLAERGKFILNYSEPGIYSIYATLIGYKLTQITVQLPKDSIALIMVPDSKELQEVVVTFHRPLIERKIDRVVFNVENSIVASGGSAWEALAKAPGVQVSSGNDLTANRKNAQVYLDGKALKLFGEDLSAYLQGLPSDLVAQVEVYTNPPAKFEAEGASVINIVTKKAKRQGFNVTLNNGFTQGTYSTYNGSGNFNYRKDNLNIYGSYGFAHRHNFQDHNNDIDYGDSFWNAPNRIITRSDNHNYRLGVDYQLANNQVLGLLITGSNRNGSSNAHSITQVTGKPMVLDSTLITDNSIRNSGNQYAYNLNYNIKLDSGKKSINLDFDYSPYQSQNGGWTDNSSFLPDGSQTSNQFHIYTPSSQKIDIYSGKADMNYRLFGKWESGSGLKYNSTRSYSTFDYFNRNGSLFEGVTENSNYFIYKEKTVAAYTSTSGIFGKWTLQAGLRGEYTRTSGYSITLDAFNTRSYFKLFPTLFIQYHPGNDNQLQLNYAYRIERPEYNRLNPARRFNSPYNIYVGNPGLQPSFTHSLELSYTYKQHYVITGYFSNTSDIFSNINIQDNANKIYYGTHANLGLSRSAGVRLSASIRAADWWNMDLLAEGYRQQDKSAYLSSNYNYHIYSYNATLKQSFTIDKKSAMKAEISGALIGPAIQGIYRVNYNSEVDAGIKTNILNGNGTLRLAVNDIFNTNYYLIGINYLDQHSTSLHHVESRNFSLSLSYRFGKDVAASRKRITGSEEEKKRTQ
ncbi:TonB-dependent receptor [Chryseobacterium sp. ISL-6]|uniref:TonB-dependent receptor domain-containing protein n=1 Tax=Chryseobacterium sp. ISL-6 TaxID=2819143 RepID=UPI001BE51F67|nr:TonB-dependent receptor [Chryseobacterium sp. ISL-6]MBT2622649.1 TonB-dependent receptor [Chryseobacterium sp. ISL-6]